MTTADVRARRRSRRASRSSVHMTRKPIARMSARLTVPGDVPVHLLEGDAEDRREEEEARDLHARLRSSSASSSTRVSRASRRRVSGSSGVPSSSPARQRAWRPSSASRIAADVVGRRDDAGAGLADQLGGGTVGRDDGEDRPLGGEVLEHLPGEDASPRPPASGISSSSASESRCSSSERRRGT